MDSEMDKIFLKFYKNYLNLNEIEDYWEENFQESKVIEFNLDEDEE